MSIVKLGDLHIRKEEPFINASEKFFKWFVEQDFNNENNILVQLGDFFHYSKPSPLAYEQVLRALEKFKFQQIVILGGNHDYERADDSWAFYPFKNFPNVRYVMLPEIMEIEGKTCMLLPHCYLTSKQRTEESFYKKTIDNLFAQAGKPIDLTFHHLETEKQNYTDKYDIESKDFHGEALGGHIHIQNDGYIGVPYPTRADEAHQRGRILVGDKEVQVPLFLDYESIMYGAEPKYNSEGFTLFNIIDSPSEKEARKKYSDLYINKIEILLTTISENSTAKDCGKKSVIEFFEDFCKEKNLNKKIKAKIDGVLPKEKP